MGNIKTSFFLVALIWIIYLLDLFLPIDLRQYGIIPRTIDGLKGILFMPFLHQDLKHLIANSGALFILLIISISYSYKLTISALCTIVILGGGLVWLLGSPNTVHIGASGVIFGLVGFLLSIGWLRKDWKAIVVSLLVFVTYGGIVLSLLSYKSGVSWSGHFFGFTSGFLSACFNKNSR